MTGKSLPQSFPSSLLDPRVEPGFPKRSCAIKKLERQSIQSETIAP
jgi:hypothetical protein